MAAKQASTKTEAPPLREDGGGIRAEFIDRVVQAIDRGDAATLRALVGDLHESDLGAVLETLDPEHRPGLVGLLGRDFDFTALTEVDVAVREEILEELPPGQVAQGVREMETDDAVAILADLPKEEQSAILEQLPAPERVALRRSLDYPADSAGRRMQAVHRRAAYLGCRSGDRLHARDGGIARALLRALRRR